MNPNPAGITRRRFIGQSACAGLGLSGLLSTMGTLRLFNATLSAATVPEDYRAIVCLFLYGGNDGNNMIIPRDTAGYSSYQAARSILALPRTNLLAIGNPNGDGHDYALHPEMGALQSIYNAGRMAVLANVGTLVAPITKAEYDSGGAAVPPYLFSHNDQQVQWQTSVPDSPKKVGWGGRLADLKQALNGGSQISMNISLAGNNFFQVGEEVFQYHVTPEGSIGLSEYSADWAPRQQMYHALDQTLGMSYGHLFETEYAAISRRAIANDTLLKSTLAGFSSFVDKFPRAVDANGDITELGAQLRMVLRLIASRQALGMKRQIYFCSVGGFDTHDDQLTDHGALMKMLSNAIADFYQATVDIGVANNVTLYTASDFNRTYSTNGQGSDHAWGSHQLVVGGAVAGGKIYGRMPVPQTSGPDDTGDRGAWIPTISVDEYAATLAKWFGVSPTEMSLVLPNINRFAHPDLGFMG
jgi:uncharacterized protein (DUF1501 family)